MNELVRNGSAKFNNANYWVIFPLQSHDSVGSMTIDIPIMLMRHRQFVDERDRSVGFLSPHTLLSRLKLRDSFLISMQL